MASTSMSDMPTFENQKEESLTMEARRPDNRGQTIEARRADKLKSSYGVWGSAVSSPTGVWGKTPADFYYGAV